MQELQAVLNAAWSRGELSYLYHQTQQTISDAVRTSNSKKFFLLCSRRLGKSFYLVCEAFSLALRKPNARVLYLAPWSKDAATIATDLATQILADCPRHLRPDYKAQDKEFVFRNGSVVRLKGTNGEHAQFLRGGAADLVILDECGLMDELRHVVTDVCMPMTLTTKGRIILASTPPMSPGHESATIYEDLATAGATAVFTLLDAPHITYEEKFSALAEAGEAPETIPSILSGGAQPQGTTARREYFCQFVTDANSAVVREWDDAARKDCIRDYPRPPYFDAYVSMDPGMKDRTGVLFAFADFGARKLIIEDELVLRGPNTLQIASAVKEREAALWNGRIPYLRVSDVDLRLIADLQQMHGLQFQKTRKEDSLGAVNLMRTMVQNRQIVIHPRCKNLDRQLRNATWNSKATDFTRGETDSIDGHYDLVAALKYMCRNVNFDHNPFPDYWFRFGGPGGQPVGTWRVHAGGSKPSLGLLDNTPFGRRISKRKR